MDNVPIQLEKIMLMQNQAQEHSDQLLVGNGTKMQNSQQLELVSPEMLLNFGTMHQYHFSFRKVSCMLKKSSK